METLLEPTNNRINQQTLDQIHQIAIENIEKILDAFGVNINLNYSNSREIRSSCPIHEGDNNTAFSYNLKNGRWSCYTQNCHTHKSSTFGLVELLLKKQNPNTTFKDAISFIADLLGLDLDLNSKDTLIDKDIYDAIKEHKLINSIKSYATENIEQDFKPIDISAIKGKIKPSEYFLKQGFSKETLEHFMVGFCDDISKPMYMRSFAPIVDETGTKIIGVTGRIVYDQCEYCSKYHLQGKGCPTDNPNIRVHPKWKHFGFAKSSVLYNINEAKEHIQKTSSVIITEGPKELWWLYQHGIKNTLCLFGLTISKYQLIKLIECGVKTIILALDRDERGSEAEELIVNQYSNYFKIVSLSKLPIKYKDLDEVSEQNFKEHIVPFLKGLEF